MYTVKITNENLSLIFFYVVNFYIKLYNKPLELGETLTV